MQCLPEYVCRVYRRQLGTVVFGEEHVFELADEPVRRDNGDETPPAVGGCIHTAAWADMLDC